jgi:hypothetical protein
MQAIMPTDHIYRIPKLIFHSIYSITAPSMSWASSENAYILLCLLFTLKSFLVSPSVLQVMNSTIKFCN